MNTKLAIAINEARKALENLQAEIKNEVKSGMQTPSTNDILARASCNHIHSAQVAVDTISNRLVKELNTRIDQISN